MRHIRLALVGLLLIIAAGCVPVGTTAGSVHGDINNYRSSVGVQQVAWNGNLAGYAQGWANHMAAAQSLVHSNLYDLLGQNPGFQGCGEVILDGPGNMSPQQIVDAWIASPPHQVILRTPAYTVSGNAVAVGPDGRLWAVAEFCY